MPFQLLDLACCYFDAYEDGEDALDIVATAEKTILLLKKTQRNIMAFLLTKICMKDKNEGSYLFESG